MLNKEQKKQVVKELSETLAGAKSLVMSSFSGVPAKDIQDLRGNLRKENIGYKVVKLTLMKRVLEALGIDTAKFAFGSSLSISYSTEDEVAPAKALFGFSKKQDKLKIVGGVVDGRMIDAASVKTLATLPGKQELRGQLVYVIVSPLRGFVSVLQGNMRGLINVLSAKSKL